jgi:hypothetical protein
MDKEIPQLNDVQSIYRVHGILVAARQGELAIPRGVDRNAVRRSRFDVSVEGAGNARSMIPPHERRPLRRHPDDHNFGSMLKLSEEEVIWAERSIYLWPFLV